MNSEDVEDRMVERLFEISYNHSNEGIEELEEKGMEITRNKRQINNLERDLRFSNLIILFMLLSLIAFGLPHISLLDIFSLMGSF